ncbi:type IV toxin-antitoxin system AbiEi family antitoxin domain-containing protein [Nocardioides sp. YIM 152588]|uniref:type IV toxin-antitoxin system AbiEi family antitoxin domain-containing protein n=1 Tax=Nocardioides sp. YIM 152588 TaxID=3158259 RepID=UPI0032E3C618
MQPPCPPLPDHPFTAAQARDLGISKHALARLIAAGRIRRVVRDAYVSTELPDTIETRTAAVALGASAHHVVVDRTAAWLHGIDIHPMVEMSPLPPVEICAIRGFNPTHRDGARGRERDLTPADIMRLGHVQVTTPLRTAMDLGCVLHRRDAYAAMNALAKGHGFGAADIVARLPRYRGRRGVVQLRALAAILDPRPDSVRESWVLFELLASGLPMPEVQYWVHRDGVPTYRLDIAYPAARVCVEYDGREFHGPEQQEEDESRRAWLRSRGWTVIVIRSGDFTGRHLDRWLGEVRMALRDGFTNRRW